MMTEEPDRDKPWLATAQEYGCNEEKHFAILRMEKRKN